MYWIAISYTSDSAWWSAGSSFVQAYDQWTAYMDLCKFQQLLHNLLIIEP